MVGGGTPAPQKKKRPCARAPGECDTRARALRVELRSIHAESGGESVVKRCIARSESLPTRAGDRLWAAVDANRSACRSCFPSQGRPCGRTSLPTRSARQAGPYAAYASVLAPTTSTSRWRSWCFSGAARAATTAPKLGAGGLVPAGHRGCPTSYGAALDLACVEAPPRQARTYTRTEEARRAPSWFPPPGDGHRFEEGPAAARMAHSRW
jgi:hypothetical protein